MGKPKGPNSVKGFVEGKGRPRTREKLVRARIHLKIASLEGGVRYALFMKGFTIEKELGMTKDGLCVEGTMKESKVNVVRGFGYLSRYQEILSGHTKKKSKR